MGEREELEQRLKELDRERESIVGRLSLLQARDLEPSPIPSVPEAMLGTAASEIRPETPAQKIELFLKFFRCRESVFPKRWENKAGKAGYSPACNNEWVQGVCGKPPKGKVKCTVCPNQAFPALDAAAVDRHLRGWRRSGPTRFARTTPAPSSPATSTARAGSPTSSPTRRWPARWESRFSSSARALAMGPTHGHSSRSPFRPVWREPSEPRSF